MFKLAHREARNGAGHAKGLGHGNFAQLVSRREPAFHDLVPKGLGCVFEGDAHAGLVHLST